MGVPYPSDGWSKSSFVEGTLHHDPPPHVVHKNALWCWL